MTQVRLVHVDEVDPVALLRYDPDHARPRRCVVELGLADGWLLARSALVIEDVEPLEVQRGVRRWWPMPYLTAAAANGALQMLVPLAQRVLDGARIVSGGIHDVVELDNDARAAEAAIAEYLAGEFPVQDLVTCMSAAEWFGEAGLPSGLSADTTDAQLAALAGQLKRDAAAGLGRRPAGAPAEDVDGRYVVVHDTEEFFQDCREQLRDHAREDLTELTGQIETLVAARNREVVRQAGWGDDHRDLEFRIQIRNSRASFQDILARHGHASDSGSGESAFGSLALRGVEAGRPGEFSGFLQAPDYIGRRRDR